MVDNGLTCRVGAIAATLEIAGSGAYHRAPARPADLYLNDTAPATCRRKPGCSRWDQGAETIRREIYYLNDVDLIDAQRGWAVGDTHWDQERRAYVGTIIVTIDGGATWADQEAGTAETLRGVDFVDAHMGWAVGAGSTILHTTDGGAHWARQAVATTSLPPMAICSGFPSWGRRRAGL